MDCILADHPVLAACYPYHRFLFHGRSHIQREMSQVFFFFCTGHDEFLEAECGERLCRTGQSVFLTRCATGGIAASSHPPPRNPPLMNKTWAARGRRGRPLSICHLHAWPKPRSTTGEGATSGRLYRDRRRPRRRRTPPASPTRSFSRSSSTLV